MRYYQWLSLIALVCLVGSCAPSSERVLNRLEGSWTIQSEIITQINPDGTINAISEALGDGEIQLRNRREADFELEYEIIRADGTVEAGPQPFRVDGQVKRVIFENYFCEGQPDCDLVATIEVDESDLQVWNWFRRQGSGSHRKVRWELVR